MVVVVDGCGSVSLVHLMGMEAAATAAAGVLLLVAVKRIVATIAGARNCDEFVGHQHFALGRTSTDGRRHALQSGRRMTVGHVGCTVDDYIVGGVATIVR